MISSSKNLLYFVCALVMGLTACQKKEMSAEAEPTTVKVQHILVAFEGTLPGQKVERSKEDAEKLAADLLERAKAKNADFEALVREYSSDRPPGIYEMSNKGVAPAAGAFSRDQMVPGFGDIAFQLKVGDVGMAPYDAAKSPFGFHIIKRLN
jgi:parvulin-like peptidyl-prolyl isomerase